MTTRIICFFPVLLALCNACHTQVKHKGTHSPIIGTWKLITATVVEKGDTIVTDYTQKTSFIKIINESHFAFLQHDLAGGKDTSAVFSAGGGKYTLKDGTYTEHLEYCTAREWENHEFAFTVSVHNDTLVQRGVEKIESQGIDRLNIETYVKISDQHE
jgi:hypothetical protein